MEKSQAILWTKFFVPFLVVFASGFMVSPLVQAATNSNGLLTAPTNIISSPSGVVNIFCGMLNWLFWGLIVLGVAMFLVGGYRYATSQGDAEKVSKANRTLLYAAIAIVVGLVAAGVPLLISSFLTGSTGYVSGAC